MIGLVASCEGLSSHFGKLSDDELRDKKNAEKGGKLVVSRKKFIWIKQKLLKRRKDTKRDLYEKAKNTWKLG